MPNDLPLLRTENVTKYYPVSKGFFGKEKKSLRAVDGISLRMYEGETLGLVGESGCGKSTLGKLILRLEEPTSGEVYFKEKPIGVMGKKELRVQRRLMQIVHQDPFSSMNPRFTVGQIVAEPLAVQHLGTREEQKARVEELLEAVGIPRESASRFPHEFSGGQRQRICIARALALNPKLIVCDEAVSALDVSTQSQILNLFAELQEKLGLTYLFISHGLTVVKHVSSRIAVMYLGKIVEVGDSDEIYRNPLHPYTKALFSAIPIPDPFSRKEKVILSGDVPNPVDLPKGCRFASRCPYATDRCHEEEPELANADSGHLTACYLYESAGQEEKGA